MGDRGWMYLGSRTCNEYLSGLKSFITAAEADMDDEDYCKENRSGIHTVGSQDDDGQYTGFDNGDDCQTPYDDISDEDILTFGDNAAHLSANLEEMLRDAVGVGEYTDLRLKKLKKLVESMKTPLYPGCKEKWSKLLGSLKLLQLKATHHWTDHSFKALCELLCDILPEGNEIPKTTYEAKQNICPLGLEVEKIHACKNDCILFRGDDYADLTECPECGTPRYKRRKDGGDEDKLHGAPQKVAWYFPLLARLIQLLATSMDAQLVWWHKEDRKTDNCLRHLANSAQWHIIDFKYGSFAQEPRNLRFALSTDGMNPFGQMSTSHSVWPPCNDIDVYLRPLVDDLKKLWSEGIEVYDGCKRETFTFEACCFALSMIYQQATACLGSAKEKKIVPIAWMTLRLCGLTTQRNKFT
ncbi:hypothetical protein U9M48_041949 [Paspalum notatum var. saurae]|uniref:Uncharacterized protein n=1 Tax=Paspalum notatum var. saurae TaxID=547442 RepID=A0AAQ3URT6_PASNO